MQRLLRFTLDLLDPAPEPALVPMPLAVRYHRHPRADREALLAGVVVGYQLKRARRRSIGFSIREDGLVVTAPGWVPISQIESALHDKAGWIVRKLDESRQGAERAERQRIVWQDGAAVPYRGDALTLRLGPAAGPPGGVAAWLDPPEGRVLQVALPAAAPPERIRSAVHMFLLAEAQRLFDQRLNHFAPLVGVQWRRLALSNAATRWGSANSNGSIRLHWRLIQLAPALLDYVVVHELAHLKHMDHSPRFWALVRGVLPDCAGLRRQLQAQALPPWG